MIKKVCQHCGKGVLKGHKVSHAKQRTRKFSRPNLQGASIFINGRFKKMVLCTRCLRTLKKKSAANLQEKFKADKQKSNQEKLSKKN
jgi:large subunit ribosomal protein L28